MKTRFWDKNVEQKPTTPFFYCTDTSIVFFLGSNCLAREERRALIEKFDSMTDGSFWTMLFDFFLFFCSLGQSASFFASHKLFFLPIFFPQISGAEATFYPSQTLDVDDDAKREQLSSVFLFWPPEANFFLFCFSPICTKLARQDSINHASNKSLQLLAAKL